MDNKKKISTTVAVLVTVLLAIIAIFTSLFLYNKRQEAVAPTAPTSKPAAADIAVISPTPVVKHCTEIKFEIPVPPECNKTCRGTVDCPEGYKCYDDPKVGKVCRNDACLWQIDCKCPVSCNEACTKPADCKSGYVCFTDAKLGGVCRNSSCTDKADCTCPGALQCNDNCTEDSDCPGDYVCFDAGAKDGKICRHEDCTDDADCECPGATSTSTATATATATATPRTTSTPGATSTPVDTTPPVAEAELPEAGTSWPTIVGSGVGILIIIGSILLAL